MWGGKTLGYGRAWAEGVGEPVVQGGKDHMYFPYKIFNAVIPYRPCGHNEILILMLKNQTEITVAFAGAYFNLRRSEEEIQ